MFKPILKTISASFALLIISTIIVGCSSTHASIYSEKTDGGISGGDTIMYIVGNDIESPPKNENLVKLVVDFPKQAAFQMGVIKVKGAASAEVESIILEARKLAAEKGADFFMFDYLQECSYDVMGDNGFFKYNFPYGEFSVWLYKPSISGIYFYDENDAIKNFHPESNALEAGMMLGDVVIEIDHINLKDKCMAQHLNGIKPGDKNTYTVLRNGERIDFVLIALPNVKME